MFDELVKSVRTHGFLYDSKLAVSAADAIEELVQVRDHQRDIIRQMTDEELADFLDRWKMGDVDYSKTFCNLCDGQYDCHDDCLMDWLKSPVEEVQDG